MLKRILWIEDGAFVEYPEMVAEVYVAGEFDLVIAHDVSDGLVQLHGGEFDAVVVDIRLTPGSHPRFVELYNQHSANPAAARLGIALIESLLGKRADLLDPDEIPVWIYPECLGVLTIEEEGEIGPHLQELGITCYRTKQTRNHSSRLLLEVISEVLANRPRRS